MVVWVRVLLALLLTVALQQALTEGLPLPDAPPEKLAESERTED